MKKTLFCLTLLTISFSSFAANLSDEDKVQISKMRQNLLDNRPVIKDNLKDSEITKSVFDAAVMFDKKRVRKMHCAKINNRALIDAKININNAKVESNSVITNLEDKTTSANLITLLNTIIVKTDEAIANCNEVPASALAMKTALESLDKAEELIGSVIASSIQTEPKEETKVEVPAATAGQKIVLHKSKIVFLKDYKTLPYKTIRPFVSSENGLKCEFAIPTVATSVLIPAGNEYFFTTDVSGGAYAAYFLFGPLTGAAGSEGALACQQGLTVSQIQKLLQANGLDLKDLE